MLVVQPQGSMTASVSPKIADLMRRLGSSPSSAPPSPTTPGLLAAANETRASWTRSTCDQLAGLEEGEGLQAVLEAAEGAEGHVESCAEAWGMEGVETDRLLTAVYFEAALQSAGWWGGGDEEGEAEVGKRILEWIENQRALRDDSTQVSPAARAFYTTGDSSALKTAAKNLTLTPAGKRRLHHLHQESMTITDISEPDLPTQQGGGILRRQGSLPPVKLCRSVLKAVRKDFTSLRGATDEEVNLAVAQYLQTGEFQLFARRVRMADWMAARLVEFLNATADLGLPMPDVEVPRHPRTKKSAAGLPERTLPGPRLPRRK